ncbi:hypothetical protein ABDZ15_08390 [Mycobacterium canetti]|uniref:hypothetical protein n=1 Tax=Mycobacterium canetti TaxID=78331 RepID=UPI0032E4F531
MPKDSSPNWIWHSSALRAALYIRDNADPMAKGLDRALCEIVAEHRQRDLDLAKAQVRSALPNQRYHRDVY